MENVPPARASSGSPQDLTKRISRVLIEAAAARAGFDGPAMVVCECGYPTCAEPVEVTLDEYGAARADPTTFLVLPGMRSPTSSRSFQLEQVRVADLVDLVGLERPVPDVPVDGNLVTGRETSIGCGGRERPRRHAGR